MEKTELLGEYVDCKYKTLNSRLFAEYCVVHPDEDPEKFAPKPQNKKCLFSGIFLIALGIGAFIVSPFWYEFMIKLNMQVTRDNLKFRLWKENTLPFTMDIYLFNWTNPEEVFNPNVKPHFKEIGPFKFIERRMKLDEVWHDDNKTLTFKKMKLFKFLEDSSPYKLTQNITTVNAVAFATAYKFRRMGYFANAAISTAFTGFGVKPHIVKTAGELLYDGYDDKLLTMAGGIPFIPEELKPKMDNFSWFYNWNATTEINGIYNVDTDLSKIGIIESWNFRKTVPQYETCGDIKGYLGDIFPPHFNKSDLLIFSTEVCRDITFEYENETSWKGMNGWKFSVGDKFFDNGTNYPENECFNGPEAVPSGVINSSLCWKNSPIFISLPHFYKADPYYLNAVDGMKPEKEKHEFTITIEPETGIPIDSLIRVQFNFLLQSYPNIRLFRNAPKIHFPVLWFEQRTGIDDQHVLPVKILLLTPTLFYVFGCTFIFIGLCLVSNEILRRNYFPRKRYIKIKAITFK